MNNPTNAVTYLDAANEKDLNLQKAYNSQRATTEWELHNNKNDDEYSKAQQANQITLQQIKNEQQQPPRTTKATGANKKIHQDDDADCDESNENEHLLGGQEQQQAAKNIAIATAARDNFKQTSAATSDGGKYNRYREDAEADNTNKHTVHPLGSSQSFIIPNAFNSTRALAAGDIDLKTHCKLELHKFPKEMMQSQNNINEQNGSTIILTPTTDGQNDTNVAAAGGVGVGGAGGDGTTNVAAFHDDVYKGPKIWQYLVKHYSVTSQPLAILISFIALWILGYVLYPDYAVPNTAIMRLILLIVGAQVAGILVTFVKMPDMLGMLFFGVIYTNLGWADFSGYQRLESFLREMALINIMLLAGLGLDANTFKKLWFMILRLTLIPTIAEVVIITVLAHFLLNMSWLWGILLGLVITAVSPNVVVTVMLKLKEERLGLNSGIHTLIYAMTTCNDVVAIFLFGVFCGVIFSTDSLTQHILQGPIGIGIGIVFGYVYGIMLQLVPSRNATYVNGLRFVLTVLGGTIAEMGSKAIGYPSAGALGCVTVAFIAGIGWKRQEKKLTSQQLQAYENANVGKRLDLLWKFLKPVSFALIGKEIHFTILDGKVVGYGALLVVLGSVFRLAFAYLSTYGGNLTRKERAYITISSFPKATVQAALGPIALDMARSLNADAENISLASNVLIISVLAVMFTAPLGAILMLRLAPIWLKHTPTNAANMADDNRRGSVDTSDYHNGSTNNPNTAANDNLDRNQKSV